MKDFIVCSTRSMKNYASQVISRLSLYPEFNEIHEQINGIEYLSVDRFANGEMEVTVNSSIRGKDIFLFSSSARNEAGISVEEAKIELYNTVDALKRSQAHKVIVFEPFISCSRSDRTTRRNSVGLWVHLKTLLSLGTDHLITFQLHSDKSKTMVDPAFFAIDDIPALSLLKKYLCDEYIKTEEYLENEVKKNWAFCSVDAGGENFTRVFANSFGASLVVAHKQRDYSKVNTVESINILSAEPVEGKILWIIDDMIDTADSVYTLVRALSLHKPKEINIAVIHALFSDPACERLNSLFKEKLLNHLVVTDSISLTEKLSNMEVVKSADHAAKIIKTIICQESMSKLLKPFDALRYIRKIDT